MKMSKLFTAMAAAGLVMTPIAAEAQSRAGDNGNSAGNGNGNNPAENGRKDRRTKPRMGMGTDGLLIAIAASGLMGLGLAIALSNQKSNGTN